MSFRAKERYGGSCVITSNNRGNCYKGNPANRNGRFQGMYPRLRYPLNQFEGPMGVFCDSRPPMSGQPMFHCAPYRGGAPPSHRFVPCHINGPRWMPRHSHSEKDLGFHKEIVEDEEIETLPMSRLALQPSDLGEKFPSTSPVQALSVREDERDSLSPPSSSDAVSVTSDEGSTGTSENSLPRIIKPRKRRKKDRKPLSVTTTTVPSPCSSEHSNKHEYFNPTSSPRNCVHNSENHQKSMVALKPYMGMCFKADGHTVPRGSNSSLPMIFPTPPPSPAASITPSSSCSEDETANIWPSVITSPVEDKGILVRSYSAPHAPTSATPFVSRIRISSTMAQSLHGQPDIDLRLFSVEPPPHNIFPHGRLRHFSTPCPTRRKQTPCFEFPSNNFIPEAQSRNFDHKPAVRTPTPTEREWVPLNDPNNSRATCIFTVLCYNILCDKYATRQMYGYCPPWALEWNYRKKGIMEEIRRCSADIITLQEVETDQFYNLFLPELKKDGYEGIFSPKSRAKHMSESERKYVDGCAIFWRTSKFTLVKEHLIEFNQLAMANHDGSEDMLNRVMTKDNIGLAALLHTTENAWGGALPDKNSICQPILVCTAHIHWDPEFCDVKLIQTIMLMSEVRSIVNQIIEDSRSRPGQKLDLHDIHLMLCGDLNSLPESGVVEFLTKGSVSMDHDDFKGLGYKTPLQKIALSKNHNSGLVNTSANIYTHSFRLAATYDFNIMPYTNYTYDFKGIIDYIFHSCHSMRTLGVLGPIDPNWFGDNKVLGCPHPHIPSDHFPLLVELELTLPNCAPAPHPNGLLHR